MLKLKTEPNNSNPTIQSTGRSHINKCSHQLIEKRRRVKSESN